MLSLIRRATAGGVIYGLWHGVVQMPTGFPTSTLGLVWRAKFKVVGIIEPKAQCEDWNIFVGDILPPLLRSS